MLKFERRHEPLAPRARYRERLLRASIAAGSLILFSLGIGMLGYHLFCGVDGFANCLYSASMILGGMGPVTEVTSTGGKWFASFYALYSGVALLTSVGVLIAPALHRALHRFHIETGEREAPSKKQR